MGLALSCQSAELPSTFGRHGLHQLNNVRRGGVIAQIDGVGLWPGTIIAEQFIKPVAPAIQEVQYIEVIFQPEAPQQTP
ncbi:hypothetical protein ACLBOM_37230 [Escherichia coli]